MCQSFIKKKKIKKKNIKTKDVNLKYDQNNNIFLKFKITSEFKGLSLDSAHKKLKNFRGKFVDLQKSHNHIKRIQIAKDEAGITKKLFQRHFNYQSQTEMLKDGYEAKNTNKNYKLVNLIKSGLRDFKNEIDDLFENEIEIEKPGKIVNIAKKILDFNRRNQIGQGLVIL